MGLRIVCQVVAEESSLSFTWSEGPDSFDPYRLHNNRGALSDFRKAAGDARRALSGLVKSYLPGSPDSPRDHLLALAKHGHALYQGIFSGAPLQILTWLSDVRADIESLEIVVDAKSERAHQNINVPWNVVYDVEPVATQFSEPYPIEYALRHFWCRSYNLAIGVRADPVRRRPTLKEPELLLVIDDAVVKLMSQESREKLTKFIEDRDPKPKQASTYSQLVERLRKRPDIVYWFSHASPQYLCLGGKELRASDLYDMLRAPSSPGSGGIVFLNACQTGECMAGEGAYLSAVTGCGMSGIVGTEQQTIDNYANDFGLDFLDRFLKGEGPIAALMRDLRREHPLGLLYTTFCPPHIAAIPADAAATTILAKETIRAPTVEASAIPGELLGKEGVVYAKGTAQELPLPPTPYVALAAYQKTHRALFAGRRDDCDRFVALLSGPSTRLLVLQGASGVGKTSFLQAEVIPYLEDESIGYRFLRNDDAEGKSSVVFVRAGKDLVAEVAHALWNFTAKPYALTRPTGEVVERDLRTIVCRKAGSKSAVELALGIRKDPGLLHRLLEALAAMLPFELVMIVDQAEEIFTQQQDEASTGMLQRIGGATEGGYKVIVSLRTEYYGRLIDRLRASHHYLEGLREYLLTDFNVASLREAIELPTVDRAIPYATEIPREKYGFSYGPDVADEIARDLKAYASEKQGGLLPLIQVICTQLYALIERETGDRQIEREHLAAIGGVSGGMVAHVEGLLQTLLPDEDDRAAMKYVFTRLYVQHTDGALTTGLVRKASLERKWNGKISFESAVAAVSDPDFRLLKQEFLNHRDDTSTPYLSLGHDSLARVAQIWSYEWEQREKERAKEEEREAKEAEKSLRRRRVAGVVTLVVMVLMASAIYFRSQATKLDEANRKAETARAQTEEALRQDMYHKAAAKAQLLEKTHPDIAVLLAVQANSKYQDFETRSALMNVLESEPRLQTLLSGHAGGICGVDFSGDGTFVATLGCSGELKAWAMPSGLLLHNWKISQGPYEGIAVLPDNRQIAVALSNGIVKFWSLDNSVSAGDCRVVKTAASNEDSKSSARFPMVFPFDGSRIASSDKKSISMTRLPECFLENSIEFSTDGGKIILSPNGDQLAISKEHDRSKSYVYLANTASRSVSVQPKLSGEQQNLLLDFSFSRDGKALVAGYSSGLIRLQRGGGSVVQINTESDGVAALDLDTDAGLLAIGSSSSGRISLWDVKTERFAKALQAHSASITYLMSSSDGKRLLSAGVDDYAALWDFGSLCRLCADLPGHSPAVSAAFASNGEIIYLAPDTDGRLHVGKWETSVLTGRDGAVSRVVGDFQADSRVLAITRNTAIISSEGELWRYDLHLGAKIADSLVFDGEDQLGSVAASSRSAVVAYAHGAQGEQAKVAIWRDDVKSLSRGFDGVVALHVNEDGTEVAVAVQSGVVTYWNLSDLKDPIRTIELHPKDGWETAVFDRNGDLLVEGSEGRIRLWDLRQGRQLGSVMTDLSGHSYKFAFSNDGKTLAASTPEGAIQLWDVESQRAIGPLLHAVEDIRRKSAISMSVRFGDVGGLEFSPDDKRLLSLTKGAKLRIWNLDFESMRQQAKRMVTRNLSRAEWKQYFGNDMYKLTFDDLPEHVATEKPNGADRTRAE